MARNHKHGQAKRNATTPTYHTWTGMMSRCYQVNHKDYHLYGGRGISVCDAWHRFDTFQKDMGNKPSDMTLDRIDSFGNYFPENCRWATHVTQGRNKRNNRRFIIQGIDACVSEHCERIGIHIQTVLHRLRQGWTPVDAFLKPPKHNENEKKNKTKLRQPLQLPLQLS